MSPEPPDDVRAELTRVQNERDFYRKLLDLGGKDALDPFLEEALALIVEVAGARRGYIEIASERGASHVPEWWIARGCSDQDVEEIRGSLSQGVIAEAIATGSTIVTASAIDDARFKARGSVRRNRIEAVLCAPIGVSPPIGVVYLQDRIEPGPFSEDDRLHAEAFARHLAPLADRLVIRHARREEADPTGPFRATLKVSGLIGRSAALAKVLHGVRLVAPRDVPVILSGDTGTGKTDIARLIHENGPRSRGPFIELNCAHLSEQLAESELFGHERGAFTGADRRTTGRIAAASGGTIFLDELGELSLGTQAKLLTFLQSKEYRMVGGSQVFRADVRVIAATNADLQALSAEGRFRSDLYFRLAGFSLRVPSLAERREDIADLTAFFCARACETNADFPALRFSPGAIRAAEAAEWPGNVRQLASRVYEAAMRAHDEGALVIERAHLFPDASEPPPGADRKRMSLQAAMRDFQGQFVREVLAETGWNPTEAAERLDISRAHVYNLIKAHGLTRKKG